VLRLQGLAFNMSSLRSLPNLAMSTSITRTQSSQLRPVPARVGGKESVSTPNPPEPQPSHLLMAGFEALDLINIGLMVTTSAGQLLLANRTAEQILRVRDGLEVTSTGLIRTSMKCTPSLSMLMELVAKSGRGVKDSVVAVKRPTGKRPLTTVVRAVEQSAANPDSMTPAILLFILDPEISVETVGTELRQLYGLTAMEASLAKLLMEGKALDECCSLLGIRRSTARTHLQHLFEKVGVQRQSELVSLLLKSIGLVSATGKAGKPRAVNQR
jgi:DNA-binding CsgD family transcriptional regulator